MAVSAADLRANGIKPDIAAHLASQINSLDPAVQPRFTATVIDFYKTYGNQGYDLDINQAARTEAQQRAIQSTGVKAASPRNTWHTVGGAADFTVLKNGKPDSGTANNNAYQTLLAPIAATYGIANPISGDVGHFQPTEVARSRSGRSLADFLPADGGNYGQPDYLAGINTAGQIANSVARPAQQAIAENFPIADRGLPPTLTSYADTGRGSFQPPPSLPVPPKPIPNLVPMNTAAEWKGSTIPPDVLNPPIDKSSVPAGVGQGFMRAVLSAEKPYFGDTVNLLMGAAGLGGAPPSEVANYFSNLQASHPEIISRAGGIAQARPELLNSLASVASPQQMNELKAAMVPTPRIRPTQSPSSSSFPPVVRQTASPSEQAWMGSFSTPKTVPVVQPSLPHTPTPAPRVVATVPRAPVAPEPVSYFDMYNNSPKSPEGPRYGYTSNDAVTSLIQNQPRLAIADAARPLPVVRPAGVPLDVRQPIAQQAVAPEQKKPGLFERLFGGAAAAQGSSGNGGGSTIAPVTNQVMGQPAGGGYTPSSYHPANYNPVSGGAKYNYTLGTNSAGQATTTYTNSQGKTISFVQ